MTDKDRDDADISDIAKKYMRMLREYESQDGDESESASASRHQ